MATHGDLRPGISPALPLHPLLCQFIGGRGRRRKSHRARLCPESRLIVSDTLFGRDP